MRKKQIKKDLNLCIECISKLIDKTNGMGKALMEHLKSHRRKKTVTIIKDYSFRCNEDGTLTVKIILEGGQFTEYTGNLWYIADMLMINKLHMGYFHPDQAWDGNLTDAQQKIWNEHNKEKEEEKCEK